MFHPYEKSDIFAKSTWHLCDIPPMNCAAEEYSTPLCYFNYNNAFHLYFLYCDILYHSNKYISLIFASPLVYISLTFLRLIFAFVWPFPCISSTLGKLDARMQILLHLKRFTKSRVCIRDTDSPSRDQPQKSLEAGRKNPTRQLFLRLRSRMFTSGQFLSGPDFG